ncbi:hypothetical protein L288_19130 [Sphingobium quisquiliarum P25]|uniref:Uncharacterized protein n=1 Tax=Sphingobium quisquiliarum P25 TaxID=1329909 RepID=T0G7V2_9SPHN|nr:hypothetical protein [Sphingobium quisquiliarum]EQA99800.1 hypothetical protein L288_19130 [Sphingobium quisquiliarum P25]
MANKQRPIMASLPAVVTMLLGIALLILAAFRWRDNGWGSLVWLLVMVAMFLIRTPHSLRNSANVIVDAHKDRTEVALLGGMFLTMMVLPLFHLATDLLGFANYGLPAWATWIGALAQLPFLWLFWRSHADLGRNWSPGLEVRENHALVTNGTRRQ